MGLFGKKKPKDGAAKADAKAGKKDAKKGAPAAEESKEDPKGGGKDAKDGKKDKKTLKAEKAAEKAKKKKAYDEQMALFEAMEKEGTFVECFQCFEEAEERVCCRAQLCDHCYGNTGACPSCGIAVKDNQPIAEDPRTKATSLDDRLELNNMDEAAMAAERERQLAVDVKQELLECRICLNPGVRRKCCGGCICDNCYNKKTHCPACGKSAAKRGLASFSLRLTKIDGGHYFTFLSRTHCPCFHHFHECSTMHSRRQIIVLFVEDIMTFIARLKGEEADEDTTQFLLAVA